MTQIIRLTKPDPQEFFEEFIKQGRPAVVAGCMNWPILQLDPATLIDERKEVQVTEDPVGLYGPGHYKKTRMPFGELRRKWEAPPPKKYYYMDQQPIHNLHPELQKHIGYPEFIDREQFVTANLWMGEGGLRWHFDGVDNFLAQTHGRKRVRLLPPEELPNLYVYGGQWSAVDNLDEADPDVFPRARNVTEPQEAILEKGEMLFIPAAWWHTTEALGSWGAGVNYWYETWYGERKSAFERPLMSVLEHLTHILCGEIPSAQLQHYCRYAGELIRRIGDGHFLPPSAAGGWGNPKRANFTPVRDRVPPMFPDAGD